MAGIDAVQRQQPQLGSDTGSGAETGLKQQGSNKGEKFTVSVAAKTPTNSDSLEELSIANSSKLSKKDIGERKVDGQTTRTDLIAAIERIQEYLDSDKLPDLDKAKLQQMLGQLRERGGRPSGDELQEMLEQFHQDISYQQAALTFLATALDETTEPDLWGAVAEKLVDNQRTSQPDIIAGMNVTAAAIQADPENAQELRNFYRESVVKPEKLSETYHYILDQTKGSKDGDFDKQITFMINALSADKAIDEKSSVDPIKLRLIHDNIYYLEFVRTFRESGAEMLALIDRTHGPDKPQ